MTHSNANVTEPAFPRAVTIYGTGLIGGSLALALKQHRPGMRVWGIDTPDVLARAERLGLVDKGPRGDADLIVLATPVGQILHLIDELPANSALVLDVGSTKLEICRRASARGLPFIGGHPMAGRERAGPEAATANLFSNAQFFLCETPGTPPEALPRVEALLRGIGAVPVRIAPEDHDRLVAELSHLPQMLSAILADQTSGARQFGGPGLETWTRLAASPFHVWRDILATSSFLPEAMEAFVQGLNAAMEALKAGDMELIEAIFERANRSVSGASQTVDK